jgi:hypothetical protein
VLDHTLDIRLSRDACLVLPPSAPFKVAASGVRTKK